MMKNKEYIINPSALSYFHLLCVQIHCVGFSIIIFSIPKIGFACATCYGAPDAPATQGLNYAIFVLLGCIATVLMGIVFTFISLRNRAKAYALQSSGTRNRMY